MTTEKRILFRSFSDEKIAWKDYNLVNDKENYIRVITKKDGKILDKPEEEKLKKVF